MQFYSKEDIQAFDTVRFMYIQTTLTGHIFTITLNRPEKRNAFTPTMAEEIIYAIAYAHYNSEVRCVIVQAAGPVFCAGADLNAFHDSSADKQNETLPKIREEARLGDAFDALLKPSIAKVEGPVLAGGFLIICGCNLVISTPNANFSLPEVKRGIWPMQVMASLSKVASDRKALEMAITGRSYSAREVLDVGLVTSIVEDINFEVNALADMICRNAPLAITAGISAFQQIRNLPEKERHTFLKAQLDHLLQSEDAKEGVLAFKEKRNPAWKNK
ncbi:enoyl-CoA hydratase/isomerase family protein [Dyadobacter sp. CY343]|uniref:enoyl-CoA hydratase/isomerase family protein n=1 Tax=Dyadobacter sp. CY343 TaxID=2907299 RepID=UPI001F1591E4|nr:enoyl-CoA hydratase-related protein [Dyadobacter sp. CY343]MCE7061720.1 enoyl-CoA hydratase-related protein [Dyadobacter sp. CY343]